MIVVHKVIYKMCKKMVEAVMAFLFLTAIGTVYFAYLFATIEADIAVFVVFHIIRPD